MIRHLGKTSKANKRSDKQVTKIMNVGITIRDDMPDNQLWYSNGISQNIKFLYDILELIGQKPFFMTFSDNAPSEWVFKGKRYRARSYHDVIESKDKVAVAFEVGLTLNHEHRGPLREICGAKIVSVRYGNSFVMDVQETVFLNDTVGGALYVNEPDALWISPHFERSKTYFETLFNCKAEVAPYIWEPEFFSTEFAESETVDGADEAPSSPDIYVMEPNIDVMKTSLLPLCIISRLYREEPDAFGKATILNGDRFYDQPYFINNIVRNLPGTSSEVDKVYFSGRVTFDDVFQRNDILLGHQWECGLNYLYCEALYKGVPLVHNSPYFEGYGYYYDDCNVDDGLAALKQAVAKGCEQSDIERNREFLQGFSIHNPKVQNSYRQLLINVLT